MTVEIYSDIACPWCYIGEKRFFRALSALPQADQVEVVFRPFQLDPTLSETPKPLVEQLREKFGPQLDATLRHTAATGKKDGVDLRFEDAVSVNTLTAHRLLRFALEHGGTAVQHEVADRLFEAHFTNGQNVADHDVLADIAEAAGLVRDDVLVYLSVGEGEREVRQEIAEAQQLGIRAVPTFVFNGRTGIQGAQPVSTFMQAIEELQQESVPVATNGSSDEDCADGSCDI